MATFYVDKRVAVNGNGSQASPTIWTQHVGELNFDCVAVSGTIVGYVRAETGVVNSVTVGA